MILYKIRKLFKLFILYQSDLLFFVSYNKLVGFASTADRLRNWNAAVFASFKKYAPHFLNHAFGVTEPKNAANPVTGKS